MSSRSSVGLYRDQRRWRISSILDPVQCTGRLIGYDGGPHVTCHVGGIDAHGTEGGREGKELNLMKSGLICTISLPRELVL